MALKEESRRYAALRVLARSIAIIALFANTACGPAAPPPPAPPSAPIAAADPASDRISAPAPAVLICPAGSALDPTGKQCIANQPIAAAPAPAPAPDPPPVAAPSRGVRVRCRFANGWAALVPPRMIPKNDQFLMQALIGLTEEPAFWRKEPEYAGLAPFAARRCAATGVAFEVPAGKYVLLVGEAGTFQTRGDYSSNGVRRSLTITAGDAPVDVDLRAADLIESFPCISCPFVVLVDPSGDNPPAVVILAYRLGAERGGTDRVPIARLPVSGGHVRARIFEVEHEVTHLDALALDIGGVRVTPTARALSETDGVEVVLARDRVVDVDFELPAGLRDTSAATLVATGHYDREGL